MAVKLIKKYDYYASLLNSSFRAYYEKAIDALAKGNNHIRGRVEAGDDFEAQYKLLYLAIDMDNPEIFFYDKEVQRATDGNELILDYKFVYDEKDIKEMDRELNEEVDRIVAIINKIDDIYDKLYRLNRYLTIRCREYMSWDHVASNAYGALISKKSRCEGICKAAKMILDRLGIENFIAVGDATNNGTKQAHSWNMVKVNDQWYHFDFMWDLGLAREGKYPIPIYTFLDDATIYIDHRPSYKYPCACDTSHLYWNVHNVQIKSVFDLGKVEIVPFKSNYFALAMFPEPLTPYEADYELAKWGMDNFNPGEICNYFTSSYVSPLKIGIFYFENQRL